MSMVKWNIFAYYNIKHVTGVPHNSTGQTVIERSNHNLKDMFNKQEGVMELPVID